MAQALSPAGDGTSTSRGGALRGTIRAHELAQELDVYMPITQAIYQVIYEGKDIREAIHHMMSNEFKEENEWK